MEMVIMDERRDTMRPVEPAPGWLRARLWEAVLVGALIVELAVTVFAVAFARAMARLADPSGRIGRELTTAYLIVVGIAAVTALAAWGLVLLRRRS